MTCQERDTDLLLLSHGELGPVRRTRINIHLYRCADCRARLGDMANVSSAFAQALSPNAQDRPAGIQAGRVVPVSTASLFLAILVTVALLGSVALATFRQTPTRAPLAGGGVFRAKIGCRPDLPNDHCR